MIKQSPHLIREEMNGQQLHSMFTIVFALLILFSQACQEPQLTAELDNSFNVKTCNHSSIRRLEIFSIKSNRKSLVFYISRKSHSEGASTINLLDLQALESEYRISSLGFEFANNVEYEIVVYGLHSQAVISFQISQSGIPVEIVNVSPCE